MKKYITLTIILFFCCTFKLYAKLSPHEREYYFYPENEKKQIQAGLTLYSFSMDSATGNDFWSDGTVGMRQNGKETIASRWTYEASLLINKIGDFSFALNYFSNSLGIDNHNKKSETTYKKNNMILLYDIKTVNDNNSQYIHGLSFEYLSFKYKEPNSSFTIYDFDTQNNTSYNSPIKTSDNIFSLMYYYDGANDNIISIFSRRIGPQVCISNITFPFLIYDKNNNYTIETMTGEITTLGIALGLTQYGYIDWFILLLDADIYYGYGKLKTKTFDTVAQNMYLKGELGIGFRLNNYRFIVSVYVAHSETSFLPTNRTFKYGEPKPITLKTGETGISFSNYITF